MGAEELQNLCETAIARLSEGGLPAARALLAQAHRGLARAATAEPRAAWPLALRSQLHRAEGRPRECFDDLAAALARESLPWVYRLRAECLDQAGRMEDAIADLDAALALAPGDPQLHKQRGHCLFRRKEYRGAAEAFSRALDASPRDAEALAQRADCMRLMGENAKALKDLKVCAELEPWSFAHRAALSGVGAPSVLKGWRVARGPQREAGSSFLKASLAFRRGRYGEAARLFERAETLAREGHFPGRFMDAGYSIMARGFAAMARNKRLTRKPGTGKATLVLTGLGLAYPYQATLEVLKVLSGCDIVVDNLSGAEALDFLRLFCDDVRAISFEGVESTRWADRILSWLKPGKRVAFVTRGHPLVSGHLALTLMQKARAAGVAVECYGAISSVDQILALTQEVLGETYFGVQALDTQLIASGQTMPQTDLPAILYLNARPGEAGAHAALRRVCDSLVELYGRAHKAQLFGPRYDKRELEEVAVGELAGHLGRVAPNMVSSLVVFLPPLKRLSPPPSRRPGRDDGERL